MASHRETVLCLDENEELGLEQLTSLLGVNVTIRGRTLQRTLKKGSEMGGGFVKRWSTFGTSRVFVHQGTCDSVHAPLG